MIKAIYINGIGCVSPQHSFDQNIFLESIENKTNNNLYVIDPNYKEVLVGLNLRRMGRLLKMGVFAGKTCLLDAGIEQPDAIITGTGLGASLDTEKFLKEIYENEEGIVSPTKFIQSTHNTLSGQIALILKCNNYNFTYVHRGASFESALFDASLQLNEADDKNILIGGIDENTEAYFDITSRMHMWKKEEIPQLELLKHNTAGSIAGEGASFFLLSSKKTDHSYGQILDSKIYFKPNSMGYITEEVQNMLEEHSMNIDDIDLVLLGMNGDKNIDANYNELNEGIFSSSNLCHFKHLCGEYKTASSFGLYIASQILKKQTIPEVLKINSFQCDKVNNILLYNNYNNSNHSLILLKNA